MKTIKLLLTTALFTILFATACQVDKEEDLTDEQVAQQMIVSTEDHTISEDAFEDVEDQVDAALETQGAELECVTITADPDWQTFPRIVTIDYGNGCEGPRGRIRKGKIMVAVSDNIFNADASRTASFIDFYIDETKIEGSRTWKNVGYDDQGNITLARTVQNGKLIFPNGETAEWESDALLTQTSGGGTPLNFFDNVFEITGTANGVNRNGTAYTVDIDNPLIKDKICPWIVSGMLSLHVNNLTVSVDYGNGNCDRFATLILPNGTEHQIVIN